MQKISKITGLTRKQKAFADELLANPKQSATQAIMKTYNVESKNGAAVQATHNLRKPNIQLYLEEHGTKALQDNLDIAAYSKEMGETFSKEGASYASVASQINRDIMDRVSGKPTQKIEQTTTGITLSIDLTGSLTEQ